MHIFTIYWSCLVLLEVALRMVNVTNEVNDLSTILDELSQQFTVRRTLYNSSTTGENMTVHININELHSQYTGSNPAHSRLARPTHANDNNRRVRIAAIHRIGAPSRTVLWAKIDPAQLHTELMLQIIPPSGPGLVHTLLVFDDCFFRNNGRQDREAHGNAVVIVGMHTLCWCLEGLDGLAVNLNSIWQLRRHNAELGELVHHGSDTVAFLETLIGDTGDTSNVLTTLGIGSDGSKNRRGEECVGHRFHVNRRQRTKLPYGRTSDSSGCCRLHHSATHGPEHIDGEAGVALEGRGANIWNSARRARYGCDCERIGCRACVRLDKVDTRVFVLQPGNSIGILRQSFYLCPKRLHHRNCHIDVRLRDYNVAGQT
ncbi:hypothetical protein BC937DRAFT_87604 [Endogone sp. FLAS-F59071]|nr:hypothetical protein BC937DRAFT_87604 [Endogone sp. FLAS-F59071]|eukprot:RUS22722.1 hypothetical protein BC937DRAFT_87604 [Endogone sp. FLAS-F59071]